MNRLLKGTWLTSLLLLYLYVSLYPTLNGLANTVIFPLVFLTTAIIYRFYTNQCRMDKIDPSLVKSNYLARAYLHSFFTGSLIVITLSFLIEMFIQNLILNGLIKWDDNLAHSKWFPLKSYDPTSSRNFHNIWNHVRIAYESFIIASLLEELVKAILIVFMAKQLRHPSHQSIQHGLTYPWLGISVGLGYGTMEGILYSCVYNHGWRSQIRALVMNLGFSIPLHCVFGLIWGVGIARKKVMDDPRGWIRIGVIPWLMHGIYQWFLLQMYFLYDCQHRWAEFVSYSSLLIAVVFFIYGVMVYRHFTADLGQIKEQDQTDDETEPQDSPSEIIFIARLEP